MNRTAAFLNSSPRMKPEKILEGLLHVNLQLYKAAKDLKVLNGWIGIMPAQISNGQSESIDLVELALRLDEFLENSDALTEQFVINKQRIDQLVKFLDK